MPANEHHHTFSAYSQNDHKANQGSGGLGGNFAGMLTDAQFVRTWTHGPSCGRPRCLAHPNWT